MNVVDTQEDMVLLVVEVAKKVNKYARESDEMERHGIEQRASKIGGKPPSDKVQATALHFMKHVSKICLRISIRQRVGSRFQCMHLMKAAEK